MKYYYCPKCDEGFSKKRGIAGYLEKAPEICKICGARRLTVEVNRSNPYFWSGVFLFLLAIAMFFYIGMTGIDAPPREQGTYFAMMLIFLMGFGAFAIICLFAHDGEMKKRARMIGRKLARGKETPKP